MKKLLILMLLWFVVVVGCGYEPIDIGPGYVPHKMDTVIQDAITGKWQLIGTEGDNSNYIEYFGENKYIEFTDNTAGIYGNCTSNMGTEEINLHYMVTEMPVIFFILRLQKSVWKIISIRAQYIIPRSRTPAYT